MSEAEIAKRLEEVENELRGRIEVLERNLTKLTEIFKGMLEVAEDEALGIVKPTDKEIINLN